MATGNANQTTWVFSLPRATVKTRAGGWGTLSGNSLREAPLGTAPRAPLWGHVPGQERMHRAADGPGAGTHLAPPPPSTRAMALPVSTRARREKSEWRSGGLWRTRSYIST